MFYEIINALKNGQIEMVKNIFKDPKVYPGVIIVKILLNDQKLNLSPIEKQIFLTNFLKLNKNIIKIYNIYLLKID